MNRVLLPALEAGIADAALARQTRVLLISGSITKRSHTHCLTDSVAEQLRALAAQCCVWHLADKPLPLATYEKSSADGGAAHGPVADEFRDAVLTADAVILATPVYHGSYSGILKNALDHLGKGAFAGKAIGLLSHGSKAVGCGQPIDHLRPVAANLQGHVLPMQLSTCNTDFSRQGDGRPMIDNGELTDRIERLSSELLHLSWVVRLTSYLPVPASVEDSLRLPRPPTSATGVSRHDSNLHYLPAVECL